MSNEKYCENCCNCITEECAIHGKEIYSDTVAPEHYYEEKENYLYIIKNENVDQIPKVGDKVRCVPLELYMEFSVDSSLIQEARPIDKYPPMCCREGSLGYNIFYDKNYKIIDNIYNLNDYDVVFRLFGHRIEKEKTTYDLRVIKTSKNEEVNFEEEKRIFIYRYHYKGGN